MEQNHHTDFRLQKQAAVISLAVGLGMLVIKSVAFYMTHSAAILSDAMESIVHVAATSMALYSVILSSRPADASHPFGHGKIEFFSAGIEGGLIILAAAAIIFESIRGMIVGRDLAQLDVGLGLTLFASVVNLALGAFLVRRGRATSSLTLVADGRHVLTDSYTSFGVVVGIGLVMATGWEILDPLVAIGVAVNIIISGYALMRVSVGGLMDESDESTLQSVAAIIDQERTADWINLHNLRVLRSGPMRHVDFHLTIPFYWSVEEAHRFHHAVRDTISNRLESRAGVMIHVDPCTSNCCCICGVEPCSERRAAFTRSPDWSVRALVSKAPYISSGSPAGS